MADDGRFEQILAEHGAALMRLAASYEADAARCQDLFQEICLAVWRALGRFRGECSQRTFVFRIAHNRGLSHRARRPPAARELEEAGIEPADPAADPEQSASLGQRRRRLQAAVRQLPLAQRQVLTLALEDFSHRQIAEVLGLSENNVAVRLSRARAALRVILQSTELQP